MQRLISVMKMVSNFKPNIPNGTLNGIPIPSFFSTFRSPVLNDKLLPASTPIFNQVCTFKVKGLVRRRCKDCYIVVRDQRSYVICHKFPRHKQMSMKPKPHNTWILTHATQSPIRPW